MFRKSIKSRIILTSLVGVGLILTITAMTANWFVVSWLEGNFDNALLTKAQVLATLFEEDVGGLEFDFADELMPEYERSENPEYFQFRYASGEVFERSNSLQGEDLPFASYSSDTHYFQNVLLNDGQDGRLLQLNFVPQLEESLRSEARRTSDEEMILVLTRERESLDFLIFVVNLTLLFSIPAVLLFIYIAIKVATERGLRPLEELKAQLQHLDVSQLTEPVVINTPVMDMESVVTVINQALERISDSFRREQRFTSDAAHELRTPIAELMNMAEVAKRWPEKVDHEDFYLDVLRSSQKMHLIVNSLLELARCKNDQISLDVADFNVAARFSENWKLYLRQAQGKDIQFELKCDPDLEIASSFTEFDLIVSNLISNAVEYGIEGSTISAMVVEDDGEVSIAISNQTDSLQETDLPHLFESLWRKDDSRNSESHIGMGLTIVKAYVGILRLNIKISLTDQLYSVVVSGLRAARGE